VEEMMITNKIAETPERPDKLLIAIAWVLTLLVSNLPNAMLTSFKIDIPEWILLSIKVALLLCVILVAVIWKKLRPLINYFIILLILAPAHLLIASAYGWQFWNRFGSYAWVVGIGGIRLLNVLLAGVMIAVLLIMGYKRRQFFFAKGNLNARVDPVRWLGMKTATVWRKFGTIIIIAATSGLLLFLSLSNMPLLGLLPKALPWLPFFILFAAINAFGEEVGIRVPMLATTFRVIGKENALFMTALYFGLLHFDSFPAGIIWVVETGFMGYIFAKSMVETEGIGWAWFIHFIVDIPVYAFMAMSSLAK
jgi:membrane protease YdiL (CAAX protease family)